MSGIEQLFKLKADPILHTITVTAERVDSGVYVEYETLDNNRPHDYKNVIAVYRGDGVPYDDSIHPVAAPLVDGNDARGDQVIHVDLQDEDYTFGYSVGLSQAQVVASVPLPDKGTGEQAVFPHMDLRKLGTHTLCLRYRLPDGCKPRSFGHRVALYEGHVHPFTDRNPIYQQHIAEDVSRGEVDINGVPIYQNKLYTLAYFAGPENTMLCMTLWFNT